MNVRSLLPTLLLTPATGRPGAAQRPTDHQGPHQAGVTKVELSGPTKKEWHSAHAQYMWDRVAYVWRNAGWPSIRTRP